MTSASNTPGPEALQASKRVHKNSNTTASGMVAKMSLGSAREFAKKKGGRERLPLWKVLLGALLLPGSLAALYWWLFSGSEELSWLWGNELIIGVGGAIWALLVVLLVGGMLEWMGRIKNRWMHLLLVPYGIIAVNLAVYESDNVEALSVLALVGLFFGWLGLATRPPRAHPLAISGWEVVLGALRPLTVLPGWWFAAEQVMDPIKQAKARKKQILQKFFVGLVIALPIIAIFASLLADADPVFAKLLSLEALFELLFDLSWEHVRFVLQVGLFGGLILYALARKVFTEKGIETKPFTQQYVQKVILGTLSMLLFVFLIVQMRTLLGGEAFLEQFGLTYSEYAREGFFQLWWVSALAIGISSLIYWKSPRERKDRLLAGLQNTFLGLTIVLGGSAWFRLQTYVNEYGLTRLRFMAYAGIVLVLLAIVALLVVMAKRKPYWVYASFASWIVIVWATTLLTINVDWQVARYNIVLAQDLPEGSGYTLDVDYILSDLSLDASGTWATIPDLEDYCLEAFRESRGDFYVEYFNPTTCQDEYRYIPHIDVFDSEEVKERPWNYQTWFYWKVETEERIPALDDEAYQQSVRDILFAEFQKEQQLFLEACSQLKERYQGDCRGRYTQRTETRFLEGMVDDELEEGIAYQERVFQYDEERYWERKSDWRAFTY